MALVAVIVVILIILVVAVPRTQGHERGLSGFWVGEPAFLETAGLSDMYLYLAPAEGGGLRTVRQGYLIMTDLDGGFVSNQSVGLRYAAGPGRWAGSLKNHFSPGAPYRIAGAELVYDEAPVMPEKLSLAYHPAEGTLSLYDSEKLYALLLKDTETSLSANEVYGSGSN